MIARIEFVGIRDGLQVVLRTMSVEVLQDRDLGFGVRIAERQAHGEPVHLDVGEREGALEVTRVLGGDHEERSGHPPADTVGGHLALLHDLEQRGLGLGAAAVDLVADEHVGEHRALPERELAGSLVEHHHPGDVGREQVGGELDPLPGSGDRVGDRLCEARLAGAGDVIEEQMTLGQQTAQGETDLVAFAANHLIDVDEQCICDLRRVK